MKKFIKIWLLRIEVVLAIAILSLIGFWRLNITEADAGTQEDVVSRLDTSSESETESESDFTSALDELRGAINGTVVQMNQLLPEIKSDSDKLYDISSRIRETIDLTMASIVCSEVNRHNNEVQSLYVEFTSETDEANVHITQYNSLYRTYTMLCEALEMLETDSMSTFQCISPAVVSRPINQLVNEDLCELVINSQGKADAYFDAYFDTMCHIVYAEAGAEYGSDFDRYCVANVIENRIKSQYYPNTLEGVIFQSGQYEPTWNGSYYREPDQRTMTNMEDYLRGRVETGMPENVLFQAGFPQGSGVWQKVENPVDGGHYYCYY